MCVCMLLPCPRVCMSMQYADADDAWDFDHVNKRRYRGSLTSARRAAEVWASADISCWLQLGDIIDGRCERGGKQVWGEGRGVWGARLPGNHRCAAGGAPVARVASMAGEEVSCLPGCATVCGVRGRAGSMRAHHAVGLACVSRVARPPWMPFTRCWPCSRACRPVRLAWTSTATTKCTTLRGQTWCAGGSVLGVCRRLCFDGWAGTRCSASMLATGATSVGEGCV